jgi:radical SAM superfamily enzyme YgiQ (UPF0313 family)
MRVLLINPRNPLVGGVQAGKSLRSRPRGIGRYRIWQPLSLMVLAGMTPPSWQVSILDENVQLPDYSALPSPDLVGITAFTSQANRAYELAGIFRERGIPVVMGGIHATMQKEEALERVDAVVTGEAEAVWAQVLDDVQSGALRRHYDGAFAKIDSLPSPRRDLLDSSYAFGSVQTTRGCPLNCSFCSVTAFNGARYRQRPIADVIRDFIAIPERRVLIVDDNLIGTRADHANRAKELFRALIAAKIDKEWFAQVTVNFADDEELLHLAQQSGCRGVFIGFESPDQAGLEELGHKSELLNRRELRGSVRRIQRYGIHVVGSFVIGLDSHGPGIGRSVSAAARRYGVDSLNTLFLTPLPGTRLWDKMHAAQRIGLKRFPEDWSYYTLTFPIGRYDKLSRSQARDEMLLCDRSFYAPWRIALRFAKHLLRRERPLLGLVANLSYWRSLGRHRRAYAEFLERFGDLESAESSTVC